MKPDHCQRELQAIAAARSGEWSAQLRSHLGQCECCAEAALVAEFLHQEASAEGNAPLPSAGQAWWRAQIRARRADAQMAVQPVRLVQKIAAVCALMGVVLLFFRYAAQLQPWLQHLPSPVPSVEGSLEWVFLGTAVLFVALVSAGLGYMRYSSK